jgi:hypothetical protein
LPSRGRDNPSKRSELVPRCAHRPAPAVSAPLGGWAWGCAAWLQASSAIGGIFGPSRQHPCRC